MPIGVKTHNANLMVHPNPSGTNFNASTDWHTIGDMHGNAVKLLHFMLMTGAAKMTDADYQTFLRLYNKGGPMGPFTDVKNPAPWDKKDIDEFNALVDRIQIAPNAHLRFLGDDLCDRGRNDYFTLKLMSRLRKGGATVETIYSNHTVEFSERHYNKKPKNGRYGEDNVFRYANDNNQLNSILALQGLIDKGLVTQKEINDLYDTYKTGLKLISYDVIEDKVNDRDELVLHSHAPINEIDVLRAALAIYKVNESLPGLLDDATATHVNTAIKKVIDKARAKNRKNPVTNGDLIELIDVLNLVTRKAEEQGRLTEFFDLEITVEVPDLKNPSDFGSGYRDDDMPLRHLFENREDPALMMEGTSIKTGCQFISTHGHVGAGHHFDGCNNLDADLGKFDKNNGPLPYASTQSVAVSPAVKTKPLHAKTPSTINKNANNTRLKNVLGSAVGTLLDDGQYIEAVWKESGKQDFLDALQAAETVTFAGGETELEKASIRLEVRKNLRVHMENLSTPVPPGIKNLLDNQIVILEKAHQAELLKVRAVQLEADFVRLFDLKPTDAGYAACKNYAVIANVPNNKPLRDAIHDATVARRLHKNDPNDANVKAYITAMMKLNAEYGKVDKTNQAAVDVLCTGEITKANAKAKGSKKPNPAVPATINDYTPGGAKYLAYTQAYQKSGNPLYDALGGNASDHGYRLAEVKSNGVDLRVCTLNMLDKADAKPGATSQEGSANNPIRHMETDAEYQARKQSQILLLVDLLTRNPKVDCLLLQEADWAFSNNVISTEVTQILGQLGYKMIVAPATETGQRLVTIYNESKLTPDLSKGKNGVEGVFPNSKNKNRAIKCYFTDNTTKQPVVMINGHMDYSEQYRTSKSLETELNKDPAVLTIMGQDTNQILNQEMPYLITDKRPSVVSAAKTGANRSQYVMQNGKTVLTVKQDGTGQASDKNLPDTAYDGFFVRPPQGQVASAQITGGQYVVENKKGESVTFREMEHDLKHKNKKVRTMGPGTLYQNEKPDLLELNRQLGLTADVNVQKQLVAQIDTLLARRAARENNQVRPSFQRFMAKMDHYNHHKANPNAGQSTGNSSAGAKLMNNKGNAGASSSAAAAAVNPQRDERRAYRHNMDALIILYDNKTNPQVGAIVAQIQAANEGDVIPFGNNQYVVVNAEMKNAKDLKGMILSQNDLYQKNKTSGSRLQQGYDALVKNLDNSSVNSFKQEMNDRAQVKKWIVTENLPATMQAQLAGKNHVVAITASEDSKSGIKDFVKVYENVQDTVFGDNANLCQLLDKDPVEVTISGQKWYIKGRIHPQGHVEFVKTQNPKAGEDCKKLPYVSVTDVNAFASDNKGNSFSGHVMKELGANLNRPDVTFVGDEKAAKHKNTI